VCVLFAREEYFWPTGGDHNFAHVTGASQANIRND
jgi:hypothetical protein